MREGREGVRGEGRKRGRVEQEGMKSWQCKRTGKGGR